MPSWNWCNTNAVITMALEVYGTTDIVTDYRYPAYHPVSLAYHPIHLDSLTDLVTGSVTDSVNYPLVTYTFLMYIYHLISIDLQLSRSFITHTLQSLQIYCSGNYQRWHQNVRKGLYQCDICCRQVYALCLPRREKYVVGIRGLVLQHISKMYKGSLAEEFLVLQ